MNNVLRKDNYTVESWRKKYPDDTDTLVSILDIRIHLSWREFIKNNLNSDIIKNINELLSNDKVKIYPYPDLVFSALNTTPRNKVKVVILGQDPYPKNDSHNRRLIPQAMGLSFSVPVGIVIPSSLNNIYNNLLKYNHIKQKPSHGNLLFWAQQGCLMLNTALTVKHGEPNSHSEQWQPFTDALISYVSDTLDHVVFVLWGAPALSKKSLIDSEKHTIVVSSHPSGLSCNKPLRQYKSFNDTNHFGLINENLKKHNKRQIIWELPGYDI